jgi:DNA polymerase-3 subunit delta'
MSAFATVPEQQEAKRLLTAALAEGPAHAYLFHGPAGVGKRAAAFAFAAELLGDERRVLDRTHPDLYVVEALGEFIRIDDVRALHHDLHMRPYEGDRRVYLVLDAHRLNDDAADALLKDLEEPPAYATIALVADELGSLPETIHSRCQLVPFGRLSEAAVRDWLAQQAPALTDRQTTALARVAGGRLDRAARLLDPEAGQRRDVLIEAARNVYLDAEFEPADAAEAIIAGAAQRGAAAKELEQQSLEDRDLPAREAEQRLRRVQRGAEREELLASLEELAAWYRDLVVVDAGADGAVVHADRLDDLRGDAARGVGEGADRAAELCRETWRAAEEFNVNASLALEALFVQLRWELAGG